MTEDIQKWENRHPESNVLPTVPSPQEIMLQAVRNGLGKEQLEVLERMLALDIKMKEQKAKEAYNAAMSEWKAKAPYILKDKQVSFQTGKGATSYKHATLGNVADTINASMSPFGLHASWRTEQPENKIKVTCTVSHKLGHSESTSLTAESDNSGSKNAIQALGSTITYLERYTLLALTGLATHDQDNDGQLPEDTKPVNDQQYADIISLIKEVGANEQAFCKFLKIESIDAMPATMYERAIKELERKRK